MFKDKRMDIKEMIKLGNLICGLVWVALILLIVGSGYLLHLTNESNKRIEDNLERIKSVNKEITANEEYTSTEINLIMDEISKNHETMEKEVTELEKSLEIVHNELKVVAEKRIILNDSEYDLFCRLVESEAGICDFETKRAVACVVINRVLDDQYPDNLTDVIYEPGQFSVVSNKSIDKINIIDYATMRAINQAVVKDYMDNALAFYVKDLSSDSGQSWFGHKIESGEYILVAKLDHDVEFYKESGD